MTAPIPDTPLRSWRLRVSRKEQRLASRLCLPLLAAQAEVLGVESLPNPGPAQKPKGGSRQWHESVLRRAIARGMRASGYRTGGIGLQLGVSPQQAVRMSEGWAQDRDGWRLSQRLERERHGSG